MHQSVTSQIFICTYISTVSSTLNHFFCFQGTNNTLSLMSIRRQLNLIICGPTMALWLKYLQRYSQPVQTAIERCSNVKTTLLNNATFTLVGNVRNIISFSKWKWCCTWISFCWDRVLERAYGTISVRYRIVIISIQQEQSYGEDCVLSYRKSFENFLMVYNDLDLIL